jgi:hypothetical protein
LPVVPPRQTDWQAVRKGPHAALPERAG